MQIPTNEMHHYKAHKTEIKQCSINLFLSKYIIKDEQIYKVTYGHKQQLQTQIPPTLF